MANVDDLVVTPEREIRKTALDEARLRTPQTYPRQDKRFEEILQGQPHVQPLTKLKTVCVYCGSSPGANPVYAEAARHFGTLLAQNNIGLVYGGGGLGIMGALAKAVLAGGGHVTGIIPEFLLVKEGDFKAVSEHHVVPDMHKRKMMMFERADAFVAFPGGVGTLEEIVEVMTWAQLGRHGKPILLANINNFWQPLLDLLQHMRDQGFIRPEMGVPYKVANHVEDILPKLSEGSFPVKAKEKEAQVVKRF